MYNFELSNDEFIKETYDFITIEVNNKILELSLIFTNKRFIILEDINKSSYKESFHLATASFNIPKYEIVYETNLNNISKKIVENNTIINLKGSKKITIYNLTID